MKAPGRNIRQVALGALFALVLCGFGFSLSGQKAVLAAGLVVQDAPEQQASQKEAGNHPIAEATKEADKEEPVEENAEFKQSASVRWLAKMAGISPKTASWVLFILNFGMLAGLAGWFLKSRLPAWFRTRGEAIRSEMEEARRMTEEARGRLSEIEARLSRLDAEISEMRGAAEKEAHAEEQRILAGAEEDKQRIIAAAGQEIDAASRLARRELKAYAAALAVDLAEHRIQVDPQTDSTLVRNFTQQFGRDGK